MREALTMLRSFDLQLSTIRLPGATSTGQWLPELLSGLNSSLEDLERLLPSWSNNLSSRYFSHARTLPISIGL